MNNNITTLRIEVEHELTTGILPFWMEKMADNVQGGFYGRIDGDDKLHADAPKGAILNARIDKLYFGAYEQKGRSFTDELANANLLNHTVAVEGGVLEGECSAMITQFFSQMRAREKRKREEEKDGAGREEL